MGIKAKRILSLLLTLMAVLSLGSLPAQAANTRPIPLTILATGDIHGQLLPLDYIAREEDPSVGLSLIAAQVANIRKTDRNVLLVDAGGTIQGSPMTYFTTYSAQDRDDPVIKTMRLMDYDMWTLGCCEFSAGLPALRRQIGYLRSKDKGSEKSVALCTANLVAEGTAWDPWMGSPYVVREFKSGVNTVKVGLIGLVTPAVPQWENERNCRGMEFRSFVSTVERYVPILRKEEGCDVVVAVCHSGVEEAAGEDGALADDENQVRRMIEQTTGIDAVVTGHQHSGVYQEDICNAEGRAVPVIGGGSGNGLAYLKLLYDPQTGTVTPATEENGFRLLSEEEDLREEPRVAAALASYGEALQTYLDRPLGTAAGDFTNENVSLRPTAVMDLIHRAQLSAVPADLSICAPLNNGGETRTLLKKGSVTMRQIYQICPEDTWLYRVNMTGEQIRLWLEHAATKYQGLYSDYFGGGFYTDEIYGLGYEIHYAAPEGSRVQNMTYKGRAVTPEQTFSVVISGQRLANVGGFMEAAGLDPSAEGFSDFCTLSQLGRDAGQLRNILAQYIRDQGEIAPSVQSAWKFLRTSGKS